MNWKTISIYLQVSRTMDHGNHITQQTMDNIKYSYFVEKEIHSRVIPQDDRDILLVPFISKSHFPF